MPALTWMALVMPLTSTGVELPFFVLSPSSPKLFMPQHSTLWLESRAQLWASPTLTWVALVNPLT